MSGSLLDEVAGSIHIGGAGQATFYRGKWWMQESHFFEG